MHDLDLLVATARPEAVIDWFVAQPWVSRVLAHGPTKASINLASGLQVDLRAVSNAEFACALVYFTGSKEHNVVLRGRAQDLGYTLNEYRLAAKDGSSAEEPPVFESEAQLYRFLGLDFIPPELRENTGEIDAAAAGDLPRLIEIGNLRGTFHNHTVASDGKNTLEEMAEAAIELGLQYLGIADHSKSSFQANGLDEARLRAQIAEIRALNLRFRGRGREIPPPRGERGGHPQGRQPRLRRRPPRRARLRRRERAQRDDPVRVRHDRTDHPRGEPSEGDDAGPRHRTAPPRAGTLRRRHPRGDRGLRRQRHRHRAELQPWRLDLDWRWWKHAVARGVKCAINPDAHRTSQLGYLAFGVRLARKGWLRREDVINTLDLAGIGEWLGLDPLH